jgi:diguanylate cyclase (GGDEF)-like protein
MVEGIATDITTVKEAEIQLRRMATTDGLTGVPNRRHLMTMLDQEYARAMRYGRPLSLLMLDADRFKQVNDTCGHAGGDLVLKTLARIAGEGLRAMDRMGRLGGGEFAVFLPETGITTARIVADRLRRAVEDAEVLFQNQRIRFTVSIGISTLSVHTEGAEDLARRADTALYGAKSMRRNRVEMFLEQMAPREGEKEG